jgi:hypothetical protein
MAEPPELASLAKRYLDLWQEQLTAMAADPDLAESLARLLAGLAPPGWPQWPGAAARDGAASGPAAAAAPPRQRGVAVDEFARRLAAVEKRLAALEAGTRRGGKSDPAKPRGRRR